MNLESFVSSMRDFVASMTRNYDATRMCYELSDRVVDVLDADGAGVTVADRDGLLRYVTATDERAARIERVQEETQQGPCMSAYLADEAVAVSDVREVDRWPEYMEVADDLGFHSVLGVPLVSEVSKVGALNIYNESPRVWSEDDISAAWVFADMATVYLLRTSQLQEASRLAEQLQGALDSRVLIEQAKGMVARRNDIDVDEAFRLIRSHARDHRLGLSDLARDVVDRRIDIAKP